MPIRCLHPLAWLSEAPIYLSLEPRPARRLSLRQILLAIAKSGAYPFRRGAADAPCWLRLDRNAVSNVGALLDSLAAVARRELRGARSVFFEKTARL